MGRNGWRTAGAIIVLLALVATGGYGWTRVGASGAVVNQPQAEPTQSAAPAPGATTPGEPQADQVRSVFVGSGVGLPCAGGERWSMPLAGPLGGLETIDVVQPAHFGVDALAKVKPFVGGPEAFGLRQELITKPLEAGTVPEGPIEDVLRAIPMADSQTGAAHALEIAYSSLVAYENMPSVANAAGAAQLFDKAKALYRNAHAAYADERYEDATKQAFASSGASRSAMLAGQAEQQPNDVPGLTAPPAMDDPSAADRALCALHHAYDIIGAAQDAQSQAGADGAFFVANASASYTQALSDYNAGRYAQAQARAGSAAAAAGVVVQLGGAPASEKLPDVPAPPEETTTP